MRPKSLLDLLNSVKGQILYPNEILIIDGSTNDETQEVLKKHQFNNLKYFKVEDHDRGLTRQRNFGIKKGDVTSEIVCFLDDDTILDKNYFFEVIKAFKSDKDIVGVGGVAINENRWKQKIENQKYNLKKFFIFEDYVLKESSRNVVRNFLGLESNVLPSRMPEYSHGRTCGYPLNGKNYEVDLLVGMAMSFRKFVFKSIDFSPCFEGYGLYEDADFSIRTQKFGKNIICTKAQLEHHHHPSGRPNQYKYGKMVVRNGWYVWRVKYPNPSFKAKIKWHAITILLTGIRASNIITTNKKKEAFTETLGRIVGWFSIFVKKPQ